MHLRSKTEVLKSHQTLTSIVLGLLLICSALGGTACRLSTEPRPNRIANRATSNDPPPANAANAYGWTLDNNQRAKLADYKGKVVVLDFYATWCQPCRLETPHLVQLQRQYGAQGLQVIGLNVGGEDDRAEVPNYAKDFGVPYPLAIPEDELVDAYLSEDQNIPQAFVFDRDGNLVRRFVGFSEAGGQELERLVQDSLAKTAVSPSAAERKVSPE